MASKDNDDLQEVITFAAGVIDEKICIHGFDQLLSSWLDPSGDLMRRYQVENYY